MSPLDLRTNVQRSYLISRIQNLEKKKFCEIRKCKCLYVCGIILFKRCIHVGEFVLFVDILQLYAKSKKVKIKQLYNMRMVLSVNILLQLTTLTLCKYVVKIKVEGVL